MSVVPRADCIAPDADIVVLPEGVSQAEILSAAADFPNAVIVAAVGEGPHCRGYIVHGGENRISYQKIGTDGGRHGVGYEPPITPVVCIGDLAIGLIICMDIQETKFLRRVLSELQRSPQSIKLLCIPADMGVQWFGSPDLAMPYHGVWVAVSNLPNGPASTRCATFVADPAGRKIFSCEPGFPMHVQI